MTSSVVEADWVLPIAQPAIRRGAVAISEGRIAWLGPATEVPPEFESATRMRVHGILTPGLVNAHTHLQYTGFAELGRGSYRSFEHWSDEFEVFYHRVTEPEEWRRAALEGARLAVATGTTSVAEIVTDEPARGAMAEEGLGGIEYLEVIGQTTAAWRERTREEFLALLSREHGSPVGVSPHAPYSLDGAVIQDLVSVARDLTLRIHSHVGESSLEAALYDSGESGVLEIYGDLRDEFDLVRRGGAGLSTARYTASLGMLGPDCHLAHAIYLSREERDLLKSTGTRVALCPRSNIVIGLEPPPVAAYLEEGHEIAVGTDSLASSPSLDLMGDVALLASLARAQGYSHSDLHEKLLVAATRGGARALGRDDIGVIEVGARADLAGFDVDAASVSPEQALVERGEGRCIVTIIGGRIAHAARVD